MRAILTTLLIIFISNTSFSQQIETDSLSKSKISDLSFMVGNWKGNGWIIGKEGKTNFEQIENIAFKLDSTAILIEGKGFANGKMVHDALAILTYNKEKNTYSFRSYLPNGRNQEFKAEWIEEKFYWYPNEQVRYIIWLNEKGQWFEIGEYQRENEWHQFFEMTLDREK